MTLTTKLRGHARPRYHARPGGLHSVAMAHDDSDTAHPHPHRFRHHDPLRDDVAVGMTVRASDHRTLGRVVALGPDGFQVAPRRHPHELVEVHFDDVFDLRGDVVWVSTHRPALSHTIRGGDVDRAEPDVPPPEG
jgi:hypothetical protein